MDMHHFEDRIKNVFRHHRPEVDTDAIWENIEPHLKKKKKRRGFFWLFAALVPALILFFIYRTERNKALSQSNGMPEKVEQGRGVEPASNRQTFTGTKQTDSYPEHKISDNNHFPDANEPVTGNYAPSIPAEIAGPVARTVQISHLAALDIPDFVCFSVLPGITGNSVVSQDSVPKSRVLPIQEVEEDTKEGKFSRIDPKDEANKKNKKKRRKKSRWEHTLGIQAGPAFGIRHLGRGESTTQYVKTRRKTESSLESFTAGLSYSTATRKGLVLKTGLDCRQINEKFHLKYNYKEIVQVNGVISQTVDGDGNLIDQTIGLKPATKTTIYDNKAYNHYRFIDLPIGIGYRKNLSKKLRTEMSGGVNLNLFFRANATMSGGEQNPAITYRHSEYGNAGYYEMFRHTIGWGIWGTYAYDWKWTDRLRWQLSGSVQIPFGPVTNTEFSLAQRYVNVGVQIGTTYRLVKMKKGK